MNPFSAFLQYIQLALHNSLLNILKHEFRSTLEKTNALTQRLNQSPNQEQTENVFYFIPWLHHVFSGGCVPSVGRAAPCLSSSMPGVETLSSGSQSQHCSRVLHKLNCEGSDWLSDKTWNQWPLGLLNLRIHLCALQCRFIFYSIPCLVAEVPKLCWFLSLAWASVAFGFVRHKVLFLNSLVPSQCLPLWGMEMSLWKEIYQAWLPTIYAPRHIHGLVSTYFGLGQIEAKEDRRQNLPEKSSQSKNT